MPINYKTYPPDWHTKIVPAVGKRSGWLCEECGLAHGQTVWSVPIKKWRGTKIVYRRLWLQCDPKLIDHRIKQVTVILTVAHLDNDSYNHAVTLDRLKHLCQRCHLQLDAQYKAQKRNCHTQCDWPKCLFVACFRKSLCQPTPQPTQSL